MEKLNIRNKINQKYILRKNGSLDIGTINEEATLTQQHYKDSTDVNNIVKQYDQTGMLPTSNKVAQFLDVSNIQDYQTSLQTVYEAQKAFDNLPANVRTRFENDPSKLIAFIEDDKNSDEAYTLGLTNTKPKNETKLNQNENNNTQNPVPPQSSSQS